MWRYLWGTFLHALGVAFRSLGNWRSRRSAHDRAARLMARAVAADPRLHAARYDRAVLLWRELGRPADAVAELDLLLTAEPDLADAYLNRGLARQEIGQFAAALQDLNTFLAHPGRTPRYVSTAQVVAAHLQALLDENQPAGPSAQP